MELVSPKSSMTFHGQIQDTFSAFMLLDLSSAPHPADLALPSWTIHSPDFFFIFSVSTADYFFFCLPQMPMVLPIISSYITFSPWIMSSAPLIYITPICRRFRRVSLTLPSQNSTGQVFLMFHRHFKQCLKLKSSLPPKHTGHLDQQQVFIKDWNQGLRLFPLTLYYT